MGCALDWGHIRYLGSGDWACLPAAALEPTGMCVSYGVNLWELACLRWYQLGMPDVPSCLHRRQASSHRKADLIQLRLWLCF